MRQVFKSTLGAVGFLLAQVASATGSPEQYLHFAGYDFAPDDARQVDGNGIGFDVAFGHQLREKLFAELRAFRVAMETGPGLREAHYNSGFGVDLRYRFGTRHQLSAFVLGGAALALNDVSGSKQDDTGLQLSLATGLVSRPLTRGKLRLRLEGRLLREDFLDEVIDMRFGLGIEVPFDPAETIVREVLVSTPPASSQPTQPPAAYPPRPVDSDQDGVLDNFDACESSPPGTPVDRSGCALSAYHQRSVALPFQPDSAELSTAAKRVLDMAANELRKNTRLTVQLITVPENIVKSPETVILTRARVESASIYLLEMHQLAPNRLSNITADVQPMTDTSTVRIRVDYGDKANRPNSASLK